MSRPAAPAKGPNGFSRARSSAPRSRRAPVDRLAGKMRTSRAQTPSLAHPELADPEYGTGYRRRSCRAAAASPASRAQSAASSNRPNKGANTMSQRIGIVLPGPRRRAAARARRSTGDPPATLAGQMVRNSIALAASGGKVRPLRQRRHSSSAAAQSELRGSRPTAATRTWRRRCGEPSSPCTAATPGTSATSKRAGGPTRPTPRSCRTRHLAGRTRRHGN